MKRIGKTIGKICVGALAASLVPYRFRWEKATGSYQVASLLCSVKKTCGKERDNYEFELFPLIGSRSPAAADPALGPETAPEA